MSWWRFQRDGRGFVWRISTEVTVYLFFILSILGLLALMLAVNFWV